MESAISRRLAGNENLCAILGRFGDEAAIFYAKAPADTDSPESFYPQIILSADKFSDARRGVSGLLTAEIICSQEVTPPEPIEQLVRESLEGVFLRQENGEIFSLRWQKSDVFAEPASERTSGIIGALMTFGIYEYPCALTSDPDPIWAINSWAEAWDENLTVIGMTEFGEVFEPTHEKPAVYFDLTARDLNEQVNSVVWVDGTIKGHVFAPNVKSRREWLNAMQQTLMLQGAVRMADDSPMRLMDSKLNFAADEIDGQLTLVMRYGILRKFKYAHTLMTREVEFDEDIRRPGHWWKVRKCTR